MLNLMERWLDRSVDGELMEYFPIPEYNGVSRFYFSRWDDNFAEPNHIGACCSKFSKAGDQLSEYCIRTYANNKFYK